MFEYSLNLKEKSKFISTSSLSLRIPCFKMSDPADQPPAKRVKLAEDPSSSLASPSIPTTTTTPKVEAEIEPTTKSVPKNYLTPQEFSFSEEKGLFELVFPSLGFRASTEEETGILEYVDGSIPPFSGIIKHR